MPQRRPVKPSVGEMAARFVASPFTRLARAHAASVAGDSLIAVALAGSLFFTISPDAARGRVIGYLVLTMAPFAVVGPFIGPAIDRMPGGRRLMVVLTMAIRAISALLMVGHIDSLFLFPLAFLQLVSSKGYAVTKSALVPTAVSDETELVEANSKLNLLGGVVGFVAAVPALPLIALHRPEFVTALACLVFTTGGVLAWKMPRAQIADTPITKIERAELRSAGIVLAASATAVLRGIVGFLTFAIAFRFRRDNVATAWYGVVLAFSTIGSLAGSAMAPILRRAVREETMLWGALSVLAVVASAAAASGGKVSAAILAGAVGTAASAGRLAFDSIVQRDAPDANRGRTFASFETRFQVVWVCCALVPVIITFTSWLAFGSIAIAAAFASITYVVSMRHLRSTGVLPTPLRVQARRRVEIMVAETRRIREARLRARDRSSDQPATPPSGVPPMDGSPRGVEPAAGPIDEPEPRPLPPPRRAARAPHETPPQLPFD